MQDENAIVKSRAQTVTIGVVELTEVSEAILAEKREKYAEKNWPDITTKDGAEWFRLAVADMRTLRTGTDAFRKNAKRPFQEHLNLIESTCQDAMSEVRKIEDPLKDKYDEEKSRLQAIKDAEEEANRKRMRLIAEKVERIRNEPIEALEMSSDQIQARFDELSIIDTDEGFDEFSDTAEDVLAGALSKLKNILEKTIASEEQAVIEAEREAKRQAEAEAKRLADEEAEKKRKQEIADREAENQRKADELAEKERILNERMAALEPKADPLPELDPLPEADDTEKIDPGTGEENTEENPRVKVVCKTCGGDQIYKDAMAMWDIEKQDWVLQTVYDHTDCADCDGECQVVEIKI